MPGYRLKRINRLLQEQISDLIRVEIKDPRIHSVCITEVDAAPDLGSARVFVSYFDPGQDDPSAAGNCIKALENAAPYLRELLRRKIDLKKIPQLLFKPDDSIERGVRVLHLINELERERGETQPPDESPSSSEPDKNNA